MHAEIEDALVSWWNWATLMHNQGWRDKHGNRDTTKFEPIMVGESKARDQLYEVLQKHHGPNG